MARQTTNQDTEARQGVFLVVALLVGTMALGVIAHLLWQRYGDPGRTRETAQSQYLSLGEQTMALGNQSMLVQFSVEYVGQETEATLRQAMPQLRRQVTRQLASLSPADLYRLRTPDGKEKLAEALLAAVRDTLPADDARNVREILYEKFLIGD